MEEFVGKIVKVQYKQEIGWKRPLALVLDKKTYKVKKILDRWEKHTMERYWRDRKHQVWYEIVLEDGQTYQLYWNRGAYGNGKNWILVKRLG